MTREQPIAWDITGALDGFRLWLDGEPVGPAHATFTRAVTAKALLMAAAHDALALLAATLAKPQVSEKM